MNKVKVQRFVWPTEVFVTVELDSKSENILMSGNEADTTIDITITEHHDIGPDSWDDEVTITITKDQLRQMTMEVT